MPERELGPGGHHRASADEYPSLRIALLTVSDTRTVETDTAGALLKEGLGGDGHVVSAYEIVPDEAGVIEDTVRAWLARHDLDVIVTTGGTGIARRDRTVETLRRLVAREIPGFGEIFRMLSYEDIGPAAMLSGAFAGIVGPFVVVALPGSKGAVRLALEKILLPELRHMVWEARR